MQVASIHVGDSVRQALNGLSGIIIFVTAAALSGVIEGDAKKTMGDTPTGKLAETETVIPRLIMAMVVFMILTQLKIATSIVTITYGAPLVMLALTGALAFGLGGREVAGRMWSQAYQKSGDAKDQAKQDLQLGKDRVQQQLPATAPGGQLAAPGAGRFRLLSADPVIHRMLCPLSGDLTGGRVDVGRRR